MQKSFSYEPCQKVNNTFINKGYENLSDVELLQCSLEEKDCFYFLMKRYENRLLTYINRMTNISRVESEDLLQEIFIKIYSNLNGFIQEMKFSSWDYRIAHNEIINQYRKNRLHSSTVSLDRKSDDDSGVDELISDTFNIHDKYVANEDAGRVREALAELPVKYREVLVLRYFEEQTYEEISVILRKPAGTVATLLNRARSKFKKIAMRHRLALED